MSLFDDFEPVSDSQSANNLNDDPAAEFLAREQAEMAKIESDDFATMASASTTSNQNTFESDDPFNMNAISNSIPQPEIKDREDTYSAITKADMLSNEPEKIKKWREEQKARLALKDAEEDQKKKEWKEAAKKELEDWYKNRQEQLTKTHANNKVNNKAAEAELIASRDSLVAGLEWERVAKLCDFNPKGNKNTKDVSRMRSILLQLKQQPLVR